MTRPKGAAKVLRKILFAWSPDCPFSVDVKPNLEGTFIGEEHVPPVGVPVVPCPFKSKLMVPFAKEGFGSFDPLRETKELRFPSHSGLRATKVISKVAPRLTGILENLLLQPSLLPGIKEPRPTGGVWGDRGPEKTSFNGSLYAGLATANLCCNVALAPEASCETKDSTSLARGEWRHDGWLIGSM